MILTKLDLRPKEGQLSDRIAVILSSITAFASIASSITSSQREDVRGVAILLYTGKRLFTNSERLLDYM